MTPSQSCVDERKADRREDLETKSPIECAKMNMVDSVSIESEFRLSFGLWSYYLLCWGSGE
jgi:hypothetical protein